MLKLSLSLHRCVWSTLGIVVLHGFVVSATSAQPISRINELPPSPTLPANETFPDSESFHSQAVAQPQFGEQAVPIQVMPPNLAMPLSHAATPIGQSTLPASSIAERPLTTGEVINSAEPPQPADEPGLIHVIQADSTQAGDLLEPIASTESDPALQSNNLAQLELETEEQRTGEESEDLKVPAGQGEILTDIQVRFVDRAGQPIEGNTHPEIILREFELHPGDVYDSELAKQGLDSVLALTAIQDASLALEAAADPSEAVLVVNVRESSAIGFVAGNQVARPSVLRGITLPRPTSTSPLRIDGIQLPGSIQWRNISGLNQSLTFGILAGNEANGLDLTFANPWVVGTDRLGYAFNVNGIGYLSPTFNADEEVELPNGNEDFWERRIGGGIQIVQRPIPALAWAAGISYQQVSMRDALTGSRLFTEDEFGNALVLSEDGIDSLLTVNAALVLDNRNDVNFPTSGSRLQLAIDQSIPVGDASILYTRPMGNFTQFLPLSFIEVDGTPSTLLFNLQGGTLLGDAPPYEAFVLGGSSSVRGYSSGEAASPQTFLQTSLEYRIPFAVLKPERGLFQDILGDRILFAGNLFADYATGFGTQSLITGEPGVVRDKPGEGFGFGVGLLATSNFGLARLEVGINDRGDVAFFFTLGDRF